MNRHIGILGALVALTLLMPAATRADDFTFVVPVRLANMHSDIVEGMVSCTVSQNRDSPWAGPEVGRESTTFTISAGRYRGDVTVVVNAANERTRSLARTWGCTLYLRARDERGFSPAYQFAGGGPAPRYERDRSAPYRDKDSGDLPH
jgi:hypothetical protein